jgi:hypothetical protein
MADAATIFDRLCYYFPNQAPTYLEDIAYIIAHDLDEPEDTKETNKDWARWHYDNAMDSLDCISILVEDVKDSLYQYAVAATNEIEKNDNISFLDRDIEDIMNDIINPKAESCDCGACRNARDTYTHVMD